MISFIRRLEQLDRSGNITAHGRLSVLLTGLSSFRSAELSSEQFEFLRAVTPINTKIVTSNFPYHADFLEKTPSSSTLLVASLLNTAQFILAGFSSRYGKIIANRLNHLFEQSQGNLVIITGSCGLSLLNAALPYLRIAHPEKLMIIALGPVCFRLKPYSFKLYQIRGLRDWVSKLANTGKIDYFVNCGHLDYYRDRDTKTIVRGLCERHFT